MSNDFFKLVGIIIVIGFLIYLAVKSMKLQISMVEGFTTTQTAGATDADFSQNKASSAGNYANAINQIYNQINDSLLVKDNRTSYENVIIQMDDFINALMLQKLMSLNISSLTEDNLVNLIDELNKLNQGKTSLNSIMKFIDGV